MRTLFYQNAYTQSLNTRITGEGTDDRGLYLLLEDTIFYPEGGGQPGDRGTIQSVPVTDTQKIDGDIRHYVASRPPGETVEAVLDWPRRYAFMQLHTAQHLITALAVREYNWKTISFHLGETGAMIDLEGTGFSRERLNALERLVNEMVRQGLPVTSRFVSQEEYRELSVRSRRLPEALEGDIRIVSIEGVDDNTCGGTHVASLAEIQTVAFLKPEKIKEGIRLPYLAGNRLLQHHHEISELHESIKNILGCGLNDFTDTLEAWSSEKQALRRNLKKTQDTLATLLQEGVKGKDYFYFPGTDSKFLTRAADILIQKLPERTLTLVSDDSKDIYFVVTEGPDSSVPAEEVFDAILELTGGKGGGRGTLFQGKATGQPVLDKLLGYLRGSD